MSGFAMKESVGKLLSSPEHNHFHNLDGLRAISILWVIGFHCIYFMAQFNLELFSDIRSRSEFSWVRSGYYGVDIFFVISGFIISYLLMKEWKNYGGINIKEFYIRRALRLFPAYYVALLLYMFIDASNAGNVWANIFYVNNFLPVMEQHMPWSWSLAVEEQFYIIFPLFLLLFLKMGRFQLWVLLGLIGIAVYLRFFIIDYYQLELPPPHPVIDKVRFSAFFGHLYDNLYSRFGALIMGVAVAYFYLFSQAKQRLEEGYIIRYGLLFFALFLLYPAIQVKSGAPAPAVLQQVTKVKVIVACYPYVFSLAIAYILFFTLPGKGSESLIGRFLSMRLWYPIAQLSYSTYLLHPMVIIFAYGLFLNVSEPVSSLTVVLYGLLLTIASLCAAATLYLTIERPLMNRRKLFRKPLGIAAEKALRPSCQKENLQNHQL